MGDEGTPGGGGGRVYGEEALSIMGGMERDERSHGDGKVAEMEIAVGVAKSGQQTGLTSPYLSLIVSSCARLRLGMGK